jgi:metal-responsive CopG/Arc/MetJ family transcriptional regulator
MRKQEKYKTALIDRMMVRIPLHLHNRLESRMFEENKTRSKVIREALEKAL